MHTRFRLGVRLPLLACRSYKSKAHGVDISALTHILSVDRERMVVTVEGAVIMGHLTAQLLEQGLLPQVTPEFPTFSVSGLGEFQLLVSLTHCSGRVPRPRPGVTAMCDPGTGMWFPPLAFAMLLRWRGAPCALHCTVLGRPSRCALLLLRAIL
jgi:hypothetical protein